MSPEASDAGVQSQRMAPARHAPEAIRLEFVLQALGHIQRTGEPLLRHMGLVEYNTTLDAWGDPADGYRLADADWEPPFTTWRGLMEWEGAEQETFLAEHEVEPNQLDGEIPDPYDYIPDRCTAAGVAFTVLEDLRVPRTFWSPMLAYQVAGAGREVEEENFGRIVFLDSTYVGAEETVVLVTTPLALSCLQQYLNEEKAGVRIVVAG